MTGENRFRLACSVEQIGDTEMRMLSLDMDHPRDQDASEGEACSTSGWLHPFLEEIATLVESIYHGVRNGEEFDALSRAGCCGIGMDIQP